uniref:Condensin complex subunit 2 n=1 Tax=Graphocephala atropunctata TaxID=36148 RepID=A0A1B6LNT0_9HEMI
MDNKKTVTVSNSLNPLVVVRKIKLSTAFELHGGIYIPSIADEEEDVGPQEAKGHERNSRSTEQLTLFNFDDACLLTMTKEELNNHIQKCLEMSSEDKITPKNAFALKLIDCMGFFVKRQTDFSAIACTLDAGAKIYSHRVDALHKQVVKLADEVILNQKNKQITIKEDTDKNQEECQSNGKKDKRKVNKKTMIAPSDTLKRKFKGKDPRDRFIKLEPQPGAMFSKVRKDPTDLHISLENDVQFWPVWNNYKPMKAEGMVTLPAVTVSRKETKKKDHQQSTPDIQHNPNMTTENNEIDVNGYSQVPLQASPIDNDIDDYDHTQCSHDEDKKQSDEDVEIISTAIQRINEEVGKNGLVRNAPSRFEALKLLFKEVNDYNHLDVKNVYYWAGPEFWKRPPRVIHNWKEKVHQKKKEEKEISYNISLAEVNKKWDQSIEKGKCHQKRVISKTTVTGWKNRKLTVPRDLGIEVKELIELFYISRYCTKEENRSDSLSMEDSSTKQSINAETDCLNGVGNEFSDSSNNNSDPLNSSFYEGPPGSNLDRSEDRDPLNSAFYDVGLLHTPGQTPTSQGDNGNVIAVEMFPDNSPMFDEASLVPAPKLVNYQPIKYSTRPIRVNMLHLKDRMLNIIDHEIENCVVKEGTSCDAGTNDNSATPETRFSSILQKLPYVLEKRTAADVSPAMAFVALLTLANENNLDLKSCDNYCDVIVKREDDTYF